MRMNLRALRFVLAAGVLAAAAARAAPVLAASDGLTAHQRAELHRLGFAVVPDPLPAGFRVTSFSVSSTSYDIRSERRSDGATSTAEFRNARFSVSGCNFNGPDLLAHLVKSARP